jgi:GMP synthase (glutamine-hydrolysing)
MSLRLLIIEGNTREVRESHRKGFGRTPAEAYGDILVRIAGGGGYDVINAADADAGLPAGMALAGYDGIAITGSSLHVWQREPEAMRQVELARAVFSARVPFFGSCWGLQVAAVAAGGVVHRNPRGREIGFARRITPSAAGAAHPLLEGRVATFDAPCSHLDEVATLPPDATILASNAISPVQAAEIRHEGGVFWGVQYQPEYSLTQLAYLIDRRMASLIDEGFFADEAQKSAFVADLKALDADPGLRHPAWRYSLGPDVTDPVLRASELRNFIEARVKPHALARAA